jgi:uncharacterized membrane protein
MHTIEESIELDLPIRTVYNQWTQFEDFPRFMQGVEEVRQLDDRHLHWTAKIAGQRREWDAEITEQVPDERIAWKSTSGATNAGVVTFHRLSEDRTRIMLQLEFMPEDTLEKIGDALGFTDRRVAGDLERFRDFLADRGNETGAWRGQVSRTP